MKSALTLFALLLAVPSAEAATRIVCPAGATDAACQYVGDLAIQQAVDEAADGDTIQLRAGRYVPAGFRDVAYRNLVIRGYVAIDGRELTIAGEPGVVLDGAGGQPASAFVVRGGKVAFRDLELRNFRMQSSTDNIYDGHGLFLIGGATTGQNLTIRKLGKMAVTLREDGSFEGTGIRVLDNGVGIWIDERARLSLRDSWLAGNGYGGLVVYADSHTSIERTLVEWNDGHGLHAAGRARIEVSHSCILQNRPYGLHAEGQARIEIRDSGLAGNRKAATAGVRQGPGIDRVFPVAAGACPRP